MTITLDQLKGMNLQVGDMIELTLNNSISENGEKNPDNKQFNLLGYFQRMYQSCGYDGIECSIANISEGKDILNPNHLYGSTYKNLLPEVEKLRKLKYTD